MEAIILAGGLGTRLRSVTGADLPKVMAPVAGRPFLEHVLDHLITQKVERVILAVGYRRDVIMTHFGASYKNVAIAYSIEEEPLGTGGAIAQALDLTQDECVITFNGDSFFAGNFQKLRHEFSEQKADIALAVKPMRDFDRYGTVKLDGHRITAFEEKKKCAEGLISTGNYIIKKDLYKKISAPRVHSWEKDVLEKHLHDLMIIGQIQDEMFIDIGIPEDYARAQEMFRD